MIQGVRKDEMVVLESHADRQPRLCERGIWSAAAATELGIEFELEKVTDINKIMEFNVMMTPALVVDGDVKSSGKLLSSDDIKGLLK